MPLSEFTDILNQYRGASVANPPASTEQDYSRLADSTPPSHLAAGVAEAFRSTETPPFGQMVSTLFRNSNGSQRAGILNHLLDSVGPALLGSGGLSSLAGLVRGGNSMTPEQANQVPPEAVQQLADHAQKQNPSIVDRASEFYSQHPTLVQALGVGSLAVIMSHLFQTSQT